MKTTRLLTALLLTLGAGASFAQTAATTVQRDVNQQTRIPEFIGQSLALFRWRRRRGCNGPCRPARR